MNIKAFYTRKRAYFYLDTFMGSGPYLEKQNRVKIFQSTGVPIRLLTTTTKPPGEIVAMKFMICTAKYARNDNWILFFVCKKYSFE